MASYDVASTATCQAPTGGAQYALGLQQAIVIDECVCARLGVAALRRRLRRRRRIFRIEKRLAAHNGTLRTLVQGTGAYTRSLQSST
jgi:hypothetical protein